MVAINKLTEVAIKQAKPKEKSYRMADSGGMYLEVMPNGSKYWRLKYRYGGKEKRLAFGVYPVVSLASARENAESLCLRVGFALRYPFGISLLCSKRKMR